MAGRGMGSITLQSAAAAPQNRNDLKFFDTKDAAQQQGGKACEDCSPDQAGWLVGASRWR